MCILPRVPEWWIINLACIRQKVVLLPGTTQLQEKDILLRLGASKADCVIADLETAHKVDNIGIDGQVKAKILIGGTKEGWLSWDQLFQSADEIHTPIKTQKDEIMQIFFTSGTVGSPKMVPHTHTSYGYCHFVTGKYWLDLTKDDVHWNISDSGWAKSAWSSLFGPFSQGCTLFVHGMPRFAPLEILQTLTNYPITTLCAPPTLYRSLLQEDLKKYKMNTLRHCVSAGEPLNEEVIYSWEEALGIVIKEGYGQTESTLLCGTFKKMNKWVKPGSIGKPAPGYDVRIVNNMGQEVARGEQGNIGVKIKPNKPPGLFAGYIDDPEATSHSFIGDYYLTGDRAVQDEDGYLWFQSRTDDLIISSGYRIGPFEVESALLEHPAVEESAVVSSPDMDRGQVVKAFIVLSRTHKQIMGIVEEEEALISQLQEHVKNTTAPYKYPRKIEFVESLPKTVSGKIRRKVLRDKENMH
ncbi:acyl-coenzyme A synthetase ACSM3, mitochondrial [Eurytemora carolleeae]|uniref:acyl-coenzyme A synthetase ACSM3, mitochondrial n=1 Tax=Eurytemora carolleeae TaxID=1294199 RepID=UPI000C777A5E|nr:acyl-coenzyme A synthetase ACSM3, mitochondrial [Eurytemora carolleeae]XP_023342568.1 acyl-coenzyme A synthetase ACSM3, mitochondrial [Eurytemora carolleeae]|eukprot:XP_023342567.1 acyl-coenzyme A synthetase ACSM3, mitochondrial-like [Eurytemora affinis]